MAYDHTVSHLIFDWLHPHFMAAITLLLAAIYLFKYVCVRSMPNTNSRHIYILRSFLWFLFAVSWGIFPYISLLSGRSMMRAMVAIIVLVEIAYNILYVEDALKETWRWILRK